MKHFFFGLVIFLFAATQAHALTSTLECFSDRPTDEENVYIKFYQTAAPAEHQMVIENRSSRRRGMVLVSAQGEVSDTKIALVITSSMGELVGEGEGGVYRYVSFTYPRFNLLSHIVNCEKTFGN